MFFAFVLLIVQSVSARADLSIIPQPKRIERGEGAFTLDKTTSIQAPVGRRAAEIVRFFADNLKEQTGITLAKSGVGSRIVFRIDKMIAGEEGYRIVVSNRRINVAARTDKGLFWAVQTLRQLIPTGKAEAVAIPAVTIEDEPEFSYRGHMLDVGRHFFPVEFIKKQIDLLSYYKINTFRWHLTEDQGWRIEIKKYPNLTKVGAWRTEADGTRYGGFYTQDQIRDVVEYARIRNITVIPEIEMPGHSMAALAAYPEFSCRMKPIEVTPEWGVHKDVFCAGNDGTFTFLQDVLDEVIA